MMGVFEHFQFMTGGPKNNELPILERGLICKFKIDEWAQYWYSSVPGVGNLVFATAQHRFDTVMSVDCIWHAINIQNHLFQSHFFHQASCTYTFRRFLHIYILHTCYINCKIAACSKASCVGRVTVNGMEAIGEGVIVNITPSPASNLAAYL